MLTQITLIALTLASAAAINLGKGTHANPGDFDLYVFATSWQPEFCSMGSFSGCKSPNDYWKQSLTLHGLWPQFTNGTWPETCTNEKFDEAAPEAVGMDTMNKFWPNVKQAPTSSSYTQFWEHEWTKHGTCTGFEQKKYFQTAIDNFVEAPSLIAKAYGKTVSKKALVDAYGSVVVPICKGKALSEVLICKDKESLKNIDCVKSVLNEGNCPDTIAVPAF